MAIEDTLLAMSKDITALQSELRALKTKVVHDPLNAGAPKAQTITSDALTVVVPNILMIPESGTDDTVHTINGGTDGRQIILRVNDDSYNITIQDYVNSPGTVGNINLRGTDDQILADTRDTMFFIYSASLAKWLQIDLDHFLNLSDAPDTYVGEAGKVVVVKGDETGVEFVDGSTIIGAGSPGADGADGARGFAGGDSLEYARVDETGDADPGDGTLRLNHATFASVTEIYIGDLDLGGNDSQAWFAALDDSTNTIKGTLRIFSRGDNLQFYTFQVTGVTEATGYWKISVIPQLAGTDIPDETAVAISWTRAGDVGGGATAFIGLTDAPSDYTGQANKLLAVNGAENAVEFINPVSAGAIPWPTGQAPDVVGTPWGWWKADDVAGTHMTTFSTWADASGNARDLAAGDAPNFIDNFPGRTDLPAVLFENDYLFINQVPASGAGARTLVAVIALLSSAANYQHVVHIGAGVSNQAWGLVARATGWGNHYWTGNVSFLAPDRFPQVVVVRYDGTVDEVWVNGALCGRNTVTLASGTTGTYVGSRVTPEAEQSKFMLGELVLYGSALTDAQLRDVTHYLLNRWGI